MLYPLSYGGSACAESVHDLAPRLPAGWNACRRGRARRYPWSVTPHELSDAVVAALDAPWSSRGDVDADRRRARVGGGGAPAEPLARRLRHQRRAPARQAGRPAAARRSPRCWPQELTARRRASRRSTSPDRASSTSPLDAGAQGVLARARSSRPGAAYGRNDDAGRAAGSTSSSSPPTRPARCTSATPAGRPSATRSRGSWRRPAPRSPASSTSTTAAPRWTSSAPRSRPPRSAGRCPRTATTAPTSPTSPQQIVARRPDILDLPEDERLVAFREDGYQLQLAEQRERARRRSAPTSTCGSPSAALHDDGQGRARPRRAARSRATCTRPTARCGCAPPTSATTRTGCCAAATASSPTSPPTPPTTSTSASAASTSASTCSAPTTTATSAGCGRWPPAPATTPSQHARGAHRPAGQDHAGRRGGPAVQAGRHDGHARRARRPHRRRRAALHAAPLPGRLAAHPRRRADHPGEQRQPGLLRAVRPRPARVDPAQRRRPRASTSATRPTASTRACSAHPREGELLRALAEFPRVVATAAELREPHRVARYLEETAGTFHRFYDACRVLPQGDEEADRPAPRAAACSSTPPASVLANGLGAARRHRARADVSRGDDR